MSALSSIPFSDRPSLVRNCFKSLNIDGFIVTRGDEYLGEYVASNAERLAWITGFTGSAGLAVLLHNKACLFSDGRYLVQMDEQVDHEVWECQNSTDKSLREWLENYAGKMRIGYDPHLISEAELLSWKSDKFTLVALENNPIDDVWFDRSSPSMNPIKSHSILYSGETSKSKRERLAKKLKNNFQAAMIIADCTSLAWLLNIRSSDVPMTPIAHAYGILYDDGHVELFVDSSRLEFSIEDGVVVYSPEELLKRLINLAHKSVRLDCTSTPVWFRMILEGAGAKVEQASDLCSLAKAIKNETEQEGNRKAHHLDSIALARFLYWINNNGVGKREIELSNKLEEFRSLSCDYKGESFSTISAVGVNGAYPHYHAEVGHDRILEENNVYLVDSGAQYPFGTTDLTRTIWIGSSNPPSSLKKEFTCVLKGNIALSRQKFPEGLLGYRLDTLARSSLWNIGLDYDHGTGHGIGSYLSVHEGPQSISSFPRKIGLQAGMIISNEPGYYKYGSYGIRIENLMLIKKSSVNSPRGNFLEFETLSFTPIDRRLINETLLNDDEKAWLNSYHKKVIENLLPFLEENLHSWLKNQCLPI